jgi:hypothetical protein
MSLPVERATATVLDQLHRPDPEPDASVFGIKVPWASYTSV